MQQHQEKHFFSFYVSILAKLLENQKSGNFFEIHNEDLLHRIRDVLRMQKEETCFLFSRFQHVVVKIIAFEKKGIKFLIQELGKNSVLKPHVTLLLPILKRSNLEEAIYNATECGVSSIQLIKTEKSTKNLSLHEFQRLEKIIIAAAEQSKQFHFPDITLPKSYDAIFHGIEGKKIWFDKRGAPSFELIEKIRTKKPDQLNILIGPEGDFTEQERANIVDAGFEAHTLTPTTLRSVSAVSVAIGSVRALLCFAFFVFYVLYQ